ncbi:unnamed protein product [Dracunculus medinensis]|uniref:POU-specific domain-containing protein n=1 Tax=Dracunculus medinensis TaxID=318479 RepID=A0A0N4URJ7_DRAME|nr:unnamed protein product [Dracunculus medinensis]
MDHTSCTAIRQAISEITLEERIELKELEIFAKEFKRKRKNFGLSQSNIGVDLGCRFGIDFSQSTISRFETLSLSFNNMAKLKPLLKKWLAYAEDAVANGAKIRTLLEAARNQSQNRFPSKVFEMSNSGTTEAAGMRESGRLLKKRRKRTILDVWQKVPLALYFKLNPRPDHYRIARLAEILELNRDVSLSIP